MDATKLIEQSGCQIFFTSQDIIKETNNIINQCDSTVASANFFRTNKNFRSTTKSKLPAYVFDPLQPNPQTQLIIEKHVQRLRSKLKFQSKQPTIRRTQLGQNQFVFTNQQMMKLEIIDELLEKGYQIPNDPFKIQLFPTVDTQNLDIQACNKQSTHQNPFKQQLQQFQDWGKLGNKQYIVEMLNQYTKNSVQQINLDNLWKEKENKKKKQYKILSFAKNQKQNYKFKKIQKDRSTTEINQLRQNYPKIGSRIISQFQSNIIMNQTKNQRIQSENRTIQESRFSNKSLKKIGKHQRISQSIAQVTKRYSKAKKSTFMTSQRLQALYNCDVIKNVKKQLTKQEYIDMKIVLQSSNKSSKKIKNRRSDELELFLSKKQQQKYEERPQNQASKILAINRQRLKNERLRIIEKMRC